jgi:hypothetical protein
MQTVTVALSVSEMRSNTFSLSLSLWIPTLPPTHGNLFHRLDEKWNTYVSLDTIGHAAAAALLWSSAAAAAAVSTNAR